MSLRAMGEQTAIRDCGINKYLHTWGWLEKRAREKGRGTRNGAQILARKLKRAKFDTYHLMNHVQVVLVQVQTT